MDRTEYFSHHPERLYLDVPFAEKDEVYALGGRWDPGAPRTNGSTGLWWMLWPAAALAMDKVAAWLPSDFPEGQDYNNDDFEDPLDKLHEAHPDRRYLNVPFADKDACKALGGRWDPQAGLWWIPEVVVKFGTGQQAVERWPMPDRAEIQDALTELRHPPPPAGPPQVGHEEPYINEWGYEPFDAWKERNYGQERIKRERKRGMLGWCWAEEYEGGCDNEFCTFRHRHPQGMPYGA